MISSIVASVLSFLLLPIFPMMFQGFLPPDLTIRADFQSLALSLVLGAIGSVIFCLPVMIKIHQLKPIHLLKGYRPTKMDSRRFLFRQVAAFLPALFILVFSSRPGRVNSQGNYISGRISLCCRGFRFCRMAFNEKQQKAISCKECHTQDLL